MRCSWARPRCGTPRSSPGSLTCRKGDHVRSVHEMVVDRWPVREGGLVGTFFRPSTPGPHPAVMVLGGSDGGLREGSAAVDRKSTRLNSSHANISYAVFCLKKKKQTE